MEHVVWHEEVTLHTPVLIAAFAGWNDAGDAATTAAKYLIEVSDARLIATVDPEEFFEFQTTRPHVRLSSDHSRELVWPTVDVYAADSIASDLIIVLGVEPQLRWRTFTEQITNIALEQGVSLALTMGALLADVSYRHRVQVLGTATDQHLIDRFELERSRYQGPTGIIGVLNDALGRKGIPSASLWAACPTYAAHIPSPKAAAALVQRTSDITGITIPTGTLDALVGDYERSVATHVANDDALAAYVRQIENAAGDVPAPETGVALSDNPEGLVAEVENFLRDHGGS